MLCRRPIREKTPPKTKPRSLRVCICAMCRQRQESSLPAAAPRSAEEESLFLLSKFPRKAEHLPAEPSSTPISCAQLICINVSKGCRSILAGAFIGCAAVKQRWRIGRANARKGREKTNIKSALCSSVLPYLRSVTVKSPAVPDFTSETCGHGAVCFLKYIYISFFFSFFFSSNI